MKQPKPSQPLNIKFLFLSHVLIITLGFIAYFNSLNGKFLYDDKSLVENNLIIRNPSAIADFFAKDLLAGSGGNSDFYRPLQTFTYSLDYSLYKLNAAGYHLTNMLLHILVALCVFWLINALFNDNILSLFTSVLFVVHPIHTEAVSYVSGRADSLASFFMLLCLIVYIKLLNQNRVNWPGFILLLIIYMGALFSKEYSLILPILLLFYHFVFGRKIKITSLLSLWVVAAIYIIVRSIWLPSTMPSSVLSDTVFDRIPGLCVAVFTYIKLLFLPFSLHMEYGYKLFQWYDPRVIMGMIMIVIILILTYLNRANKVILFSVGWFFLTLLPVSNLFRINAYMAEHFLYLPSIGFFLLLSYPLSILYNDRKKMLALGVIIGAVLFFLVLTIKQNDYWRDPLTFYKMTLKFAPDSSSAYNNLGELYQVRGNLSEALVDYNKAVELDPNAATAYSNRGDIFLVQENYDRAIKDFDKAIALNPNLTQAYCNRGNAYNSEGRYDSALADLNKAMALNPNLAQNYSNRGNTYGSTNNYDQAFLDFNRAIQLKPDYFEAFLDRGIVLNKKNEYDFAIEDFNKALQIKADYPEAYFNRGIAYAGKGNLAQAFLDYSQAIALNPRYAVAYSNRAVIYYSKGKGDQAISDLTKAIESKPDYADAYSNRGDIYNSEGKYDQAILDLNKAIDLDPDFKQALINRSVTYYNRKEYDKALKDLNKGEKLGAQFDPRFVEALKNASGMGNVR